MRQGASHNGPHFLRQKRLLEKLDGSELHGIHRGPNGRVRRDYDHRDIWSRLAHTLEHVQSVDPRHPQVEQNDRDPPLVNMLQGLLAVGCCVDLDGQGGQRLREREADTSLVVNNQYVRFVHERCLSPLHPVVGIPNPGPFLHAIAVHGIETAPSLSQCSVPKQSRETQLVWEKELCRMAHWEALNILPIADCPMRRAKCTTHGYSVRAWD